MPSRQPSNMSFWMDRSEQQLTILASQRRPFAKSHPVGIRDNSWGVLPLVRTSLAFAIRSLDLRLGSGYSYFKEGHQCASKVDSSQFISIFSATFDGQSFVKGTAQPQSWLTSTSISGDGIPIMWQSKDADVLSRARAMTPTITAPPSAPTSTPTNTNTSAPSSGLSTGAKIGLGVGIPIAVIFVLVLGFLLWRRRSKKHRSVEASAPAYEQHTGAAEYKDGRGEQAYYQAQPVHEMQDLNQTHRTTHELPGGGQR